MQGIDGPHGAVTIRLRPTPWQSLPLLFLVGAVLFMIHDSYGWFDAAVAVLYLYLFYLSVWWFGVTLTDTELIVHSLRRRRIPWDQILVLEQTSMLFDRYLVVWTATDRIQLRSPSTTVGLGRARYARQCDTVGRCWLEHRGPDWTPPPPLWSPVPRSGRDVLPPSNPWVPPRP